MVPASSVTTNTLAAGKTFLRVNIPSGALTAFFAQIPTTAAGIGTPSTSTFGRAVAGHFVTQVMPIGVCAIDLIQGGRRPVAGGLPDELTEFGFRRGIAYNIPQLNPLGGSSALPMWLNPLNAPPAACNPANASTAVMRPFVCTGSSTVVTSVPGLVYVNTGVAPIPMQRALNSRFDDFSGGGNACDPASAPPDINIRPYDFAAPPRLPHDWMDPGANTYPSQQTISLDPVTGKPYVSPPLTTGQYGALWSYSRAVRAVGASPNATAGTDFVLADWSNLYANNTADITASGYPASATPPYYKTSGKYFLGPPARPGRINRRVLNVAIVDCSGLAAGPGLACATLPVLGVGKFFMQTPAFLNGPNATLDTEFSGLLTPFPDPTIRLYK